jgi:DNA-binding NtrC family response regulator
LDREYVLLTGVEADYTEALRDLATGLSIDVLIAGRDVSATSRQRPPSLHVVEVAGGREDSIARLRGVLKRTGRTSVVVLARDVGTDAIVRLLREGVADVIGVPADPDDVAMRALAPIDLARHTGRGDLVGLTPAMRALREQITDTAKTASTVLITGETGTGKGLIARTIHEASKRRGAFVHIDCAALNVSIIESELFGHEKGAFTGANGRRIGRFEQAQEGTVFLDEIAELDPALQAKFLRILQDRLFERIGGTQTLHMNARVLAATNRDIRREISLGRFRPDLYYRLSVIEIAVPPLRERLDDLPLLVRAGLDEIATRLDRPSPRVGEDLVAELRRHDWPGNVRELMNLLERVLVRGDAAVLDAEALGPGWRDESLRLDGGSGADADRGSEAGRREPLLPEEEREDRTRVADALRATAGNVSRTARRLGVTRSRLRYRIAKYGLMHLIPDD